MLAITPVLAPHVVQLVPALRSGNLHNDLRPLLNFLRAAGPGGKDVVRNLQQCPGWLMEDVAVELNKQLRQCQAVVEITANDLEQLRMVIRTYWTTIAYCF